MYYSYLEALVTFGLCQSPNFNSLLQSIWPQEPDISRYLSNITPPCPTTSVNLTSWPGAVKSIIFWAEFGSQEKGERKEPGATCSVSILWQSRKCTSDILGNKEHNWLIALFSALWSQSNDSLKPPASCSQPVTEHSLGAGASPSCRLF